MLVSLRGIAEVCSLTIEMVAKDHVSHDQPLTVGSLCMLPVKLIEVCEDLAILNQGRPSRLAVVALVRWTSRISSLLAFELVLFCFRGSKQYVGATGYPSGMTTARHRGMYAKQAQCGDGIDNRTINMPAKAIGYFKDGISFGFPGLLLRGCHSSY
ncbi:MAG TPA: hypothetical protein VHX38_17380 [Pseudonocardiaceae bacterium]|nr:hypothetical protein [Pseudonocardiaceae bacterium]